MLTIVITIILALIAGDALGFFIYYLCGIFEEKKRENGVLRDYYNFLIGQWKNNRPKFLICYSLLDVAVVGSTLLAIITFGVSIKAFLAIFFCYSLILLTFVDAKTQFLPDIITKPLIAVGVIQGYFGVFCDFRDSLAGALVGYFLLWGVNTAFRYFRGKDGMGYGDFKLLSAVGAWVGVTQIPFVILASSILGIFVALILARLPQNDVWQPNPFGPALSAAGFVSLFWGAGIIAWYLGLFIAV